MDNKKEQKLLILGYISYLTIFLTPLFTYISKNKSEYFLNHMLFIKRTSFINFILFLVCFLFFTFLGYFPMGRLGAFVEICLFTAFITTYIFNFMRGVINLLFHDNDFSL